MSQIMPQNQLQERTARVGVWARMASATMDEFALDIEKMTRERIDEAMKEAGQIRELARLTKKIMAFDVTSLASGSSLPVLSRIVHLLATTTASFEPYYRGFAAEHAVLLEQDAQDTLTDWFVWVREQPAKVAAAWPGYIARLEADIDASAEEQRAIAAEWSAVDGDGLAEHASLGE